MENSSFKWSKIREARQPPPLALQDRTGGNALCILHIPAAPRATPNLEWVSDRVAALDTPERILLHVLTILGPPQRYGNLEQAFLEEFHFLSAIESLMAKRIIIETTEGFTFDHPSFQLYFNSWSKSEIHNKIKKEILAKILPLSKSFEEQIICCQLATEIGDASVLRELGPQALTEALTRQNYKTVVQLSGDLSALARGDDEYALLQLTRVQALIQTGDVASAELCLSSAQSNGFRGISNFLIAKHQLIEATLDYAAVSDVSAYGSN